MFEAINTAASGLSAQRLRQNVISDNIANVNTTRTPEGGPYQRSRVVLRPRVEQPQWRSPFVPDKIKNDIGQGVRVSEISKDTSEPPRMEYDPTHPDAIKSGPNEGYVEKPNVNIVEEMTDMIAASRSYDANSQVIEGSKQMFSRALTIGRA